MAGATAIALTAASAGSSILGGRSDRRASNRAFDAETAGIQSAIDQQFAGQDEALERTDAFRDVGLSSILPILSQLGITPPDELQGMLPEFTETKETQDPTLFDFLQKRGQNRIEESAAGKGVLRSGSTVQDISELNAALASQEQQKQDNQKNIRFNQLFQLLGLGSNTASNQSGIITNTSANVGDLLTGKGAVESDRIINEQSIKSNSTGKAFEALGFGSEGGFSSFGDIGSIF